MNMNTELKVLISTMFDGEKFVQDTISKNYFALVSDGLALLSDAPGDIAGFSDLQNEIKGLSQPANEADLIAFVQQKFSSIEILSTPKAQTIIGAIVNMIASSIAVEQAFVS